MKNMNKSTNILNQSFQTILSVPLTMVIWTVIYLLGRGAMFLLDKFRGLDNDILQGVFIELLVPGICSYYAIYLCNKLLAINNIRICIVLYLSASLAVFYIYPMIFQPLYFDDMSGLSDFLKVCLPISVFIGSSIAYYRLG